MSLKIAIVVQRYGKDVVGGGELHARHVAERLQSTLGWQVDVYTTTAQDYMTWSNAYPEGTEAVDGVNVHRFDSRMPRARCFKLYNRLSAPLIRHGRRYAWSRPLVLLLERLWILLQGPYCPKLLAELARRADEYRKIIFFTYLYYPTIEGVERFREKAILVPLAHDEHPFHFLTVERMLRSVGSMIVNTEPEAALIRTKLGPKPPVIDTAGLGFDEAAFAPAARQAAGSPYLLYLGRISAGKGVQRLVDWVHALRDDARLRGVRLKLAGHKEASVVLPPGPQFEYLGYVDDETKLSLMRDAAAVVNPSPHESLSLIVIEAMALNVPVLVNANSDVLRYYTERVATAFGFRDQASFNKQLTTLLTTDWESDGSRQALAEARAWALRLFSWNHVLSVYQRHVCG